MNYLEPKTRRWIWTISLLTSVGILLFILWGADWAAGYTILQSASWTWVAVGIGLLMVEGMITALRFRVMIAGAVAYRQCLISNAWYVLLLIALPARLGELAGIGVVMKYMHQSSAAAIVNLLFQRLFDVIILCGLLVMLTVQSFAQTQQGLLSAIAVAVILVIMISLRYFSALLAGVALLLKRFDRIGLIRNLRRLVVRARAFQRRQFTTSRMYQLGVLTLFKWACNLAGIACVVVAVLPEVTYIKATWVGVFYNLAALIPLQTVGGFGVSEAVLVGSFSWLGYTIATGAPLALAIRLALLSAPILFWLLVMVVFARHRSMIPDKA